MIKKFLAIILCFSVLTAQAGEDFQGSLKGAFDELNYSMNVEWDQKDKEVQREIYIEFQQEMKRLVDAGLTQDDFLKFLETKIKDKKLLQDLKSTFEHISYSKLSPQQSAELIQTLMKKSYANGASWDGYVLWQILWVGVIGYFLFFMVLPNVGDMGESSLDIGFIIF